jgi:hypothetical protein
LTKETRSTTVRSARRRPRSSGKPDKETTMIKMKCPQCDDETPGFAGQIEHIVVPDRNLKFEVMLIYCTGCETVIGTSDAPAIARQKG